ncbi:MAG: sugar-specific transcriptional regulator TrmB [Methanoregula sp.]|nr:sugar-specific transcriptional regulator TrmB [Methanoregula sp.]
MSRVLEHRRKYLRQMRQFTLDTGSFTVTDLQNAAEIPRSTAQDWINRLLMEGCLFLRDEKRGRSAARYAAISAVPSSTCKRIFTTVDGDTVEIYHDCLSASCAAFCGYHHTLAGGALTEVHRDGTLLRERGTMGSFPVPVGLLPLPAVAVTGIERDGESIVQQIRCIGGPAYSLSDMMSRAEGVIRVEPRPDGHIVEGKVWTRALMHITLGVDDTDSKDGGATFALALALLNYLTRMEGVLPISHHVVMLNPEIARKTAGNSASYIEVALDPDLLDTFVKRAYRFVADESFSPDWGIAIRAGLGIPEKLREYGRLVRDGIATREAAESLAGSLGITLIGGYGVIGALGAVALAGLPEDVLLDPSRKIR